jgi:TatD DNase family protein
MYIDSHSHWSDLRFQNKNQEWLLKKAFEKQITQFMLGGVDPDDWNRQIELIHKYPQTFFKCFGLHPYFVSKKSYQDCERALDQLALLMNSSLALGETGLDFRESILNSHDKDPYENKSQQIEFFENQLQIAASFKKPVVLHIVRAHDKAIEVLDLFSQKNQHGFVHAFNGSFEVAKSYLDRGFLISVGGACTYEKNQKLRLALAKIPLECLLIESDSPDQAPEGWSGLNDSSSLWQVAKVVADLTHRTSEDIMQISTNNFKKLFSL